MISDLKYYEEKLNRIRKRGLITSVLQHPQFEGFSVCSNTLHHAQYTANTTKTEIN